MRQLLFVAGQVAEEYLAFCKFKTQKATQKIYLAQAYQTLEMEDAFLGTIGEKTIKSEAVTYPILENETQRSAAYFYQNYELHRTYHDFYQNIRPIREDYRLKEGVEALTYFYFIAMLRQGVKMLSHQGSFNIQYDFAFLQNTLQHIESEQLNEKSIALNAHYCAYKMLENKNNSIDYYQNLRNVLNDYQPIFELGDLIEFYGIAINFCSSQIPQNRDFFILQCYELYEKGLGNNILTANEGNLKNYTTLGNYLKKYDNTVSFLQKHEATHHDIFFYNMARVYFSQENYKAFRENLQKIEYRNQFFRTAANNNDMRSMEIVVFYEEKEDQLLDYALTNFYNSLRQQKSMTDAYKKQFFLFISIVRQLYNYNGKIPKNKRAKLIEKIQNNPIVEKNWLLIKLS
jgi:hypothetical protein